MNIILRTKIETCLELASGKTEQKLADDFKKKVLKVTNISVNNFNEMGLTDASYKKLLSGQQPNDIINELF